MGAPMLFIGIIVHNGNNKYSSDMETRKKIEDILLTDYGCFDDFTVDKLLDLFGVSQQRELLLAWERWKVEKGNYPEFRTKEQMLNDYLSQ